MYKTVFSAFCFAFVCGSVFGQTGTSPRAALLPGPRETKVPLFVARMSQGMVGFFTGQHAVKEINGKDSVIMAETVKPFGEFVLRGVPADKLSGKSQVPLIGTYVVKGLFDIHGRPLWVVVPKSADGSPDVSETITVNAMENGMIGPLVGPPPAGATPHYDVLKVLGENKALMSERFLPRRQFLLEGVSTKQWVDGSTVKLPGLYLVKDKATADGETLWLVVPYMPPEPKTAPRKKK